MIRHMNESIQSGNEEISQHILDAARERFTQYGYNKTTMAEIAKDCGMSASNIYRFFANKLDIGASLACCSLESGLTHITAIVSDPQYSADIRLRQFIHAILDDTHRLWSENPKINELVVAICADRMDIVANHKQKKQTLLETLLTAGINAGEFEITDLATTAEAILTATTLFGMPTLMPLFHYDVLSHKADIVCDLLLQGIMTRSV